MTHLPLGFSLEILRTFIPSVFDFKAFSHGGQTNIFINACTANTYRLRARAGKIHQLTCEELQKQKENEKTAAFFWSLPNIIVVATLRLV